METKQEIREQMLKIRRGMEAEEWQAATDAIAGKVIESDSFREATDFYCYMDFDREAGTDRIMDEAWRLGKDIWLPKVSGGEMEFFLVKPFQKFVKGSFGILEPSGASEMAKGTDGLAIVPGVAFDREKNRIGYGKGFYDRYLRKHPHLVKMGIAFDVQLVDKIPKEETDCGLDFVVTESFFY